MLTTKNAGSLKGGPAPLGGRMKLKIIRDTVANCKRVKVGDIVEVDAKAASQLKLNGKAIDFVEEVKEFVPPAEKYAPKTSTRKKK